MSRWLDRLTHLGVIAALATSFVALACATTVEEKPKAVPRETGFLGDVYEKLTPGQEGEAALRYVAPDVDWKQYHSLLLEPVQFWSGEDSKVSPENQQMLTSYLYIAMRRNLVKERFNLTSFPGKGTIRVQTAITDVTAATPVLRTVSVIVPQARLLNQAQNLVTGSYTFSGSAEVALKATDARSGELLGAAVDRRGGGGAAGAAAQWQWGDAKAAIDLWAQRFTQRLLELQQKKAAQP